MLRKSIILLSIISISSNSIALDNISLAKIISDKHKSKYSETLTAVIAISECAKTSENLKLDLLAIAAVESNFRNNARNKGNYGIMQINQVHGIKTNINENINAACNILKENYKQSKSQDLALQAYNLGINAVKQGKRNQHYLNKINNEKQFFLNVFKKHDLEKNLASNSDAQQI